VSEAASSAEGATRVVAAALLRSAARGEPCGGPHLLVQESGQAVRRVALGAELTVGRGRAAALRLGDAGVSRLHARFLVAPDGGVTVEDLGSKNGVRSNGRLLGRGPTAIAPGDAVVIGATRLVYADPLAEAGAEAEAGGLAEGVGVGAAGGRQGGGGSERGALRGAGAGLLRAPGLLLGAAAALLALAGVLLLTGG
jgi:hypothetical protein